MDGIEEARRDLVVAALRHCRRARHRVLEDGLQFGDEGGAGAYLPVVEQRRDGGVLRALQRAPLLFLAPRQIHDEIDGELLVRRIGRDAEQLPAQHGVRGALRPAGRQGREADPVLDRTVRPLAQRPGIGPVAHEERVAGLEHAACLLLRIVQHAARADGADEPGGCRQRILGAGIVDGDPAGIVDDGAAAAGGDPFERIDREPLIGPPLPDIAPEARIAGRALARLDELRGLGELAPGPRHRPPHRVQQVLAVIEQAGIGEPGHGHEPAVDGRALDHGRQMFGGARPRRLGEIDEVAREDAGPDHVDLEDVDVGSVGGEDLLIEREAFGRRIGGRDDVHRISGALRPFVDSLLAELALLAERAAGDGEFRRPPARHA